MHPEHCEIQQQHWQLKMRYGILSTHEGKRQQQQVVQQQYRL
jgi:hypothetical protein